MKMAFLITVLFTFLCSVSAFAQDSSESKVSIQSADVKPKPPQFIGAVDYLNYDFQGQGTASTGIYKFGAARTEVTLASLTYLHSPQWMFLTFVPHIKNKVETIYVPSLGGVSLTDETQGLGDIQFMAMSPLIFTAKQSLFYDLGFTAPTGSVDEVFSSTPIQRAAYNMQLGSGTPDLVFGTTYNRSEWGMSHKVRGQAKVRIGRNKNDWALGDELKINWTSFYKPSFLGKFGTYIQVGLQGDYQLRGAVSGRDAEYELFNDFQAPGIEGGDGHQYYKSSQAFWLTSAVAKIEAPLFASVSGSLEVGIPFYQDSSNQDNIRLDIKNFTSAGIKGSF